MERALLATVRAVTVRGEAVRGASQRVGSCIFDQLRCDADRELVNNHILAILKKAERPTEQSKCQAKRPVECQAKRPVECLVDVFERDPEAPKELPVSPPPAEIVYDLPYGNIERGSMEDYWFTAGPAVPSFDEWVAQYNPKVEDDYSAARRKAEEDYLAALRKAEEEEDLYD